MTPPPSPEIDHLIDLIGSTRSLTAATLRRLVTNRRIASSPDAQHVAQRLLDVADPTAVTHPVLRIVQRHKLAIGRGISFHAMIIERAEALRIGVQDRERALDNKATGYRFADALGIRRPAGDPAVVQFGDIEPRPGIVIKPVQSTGARGVFLVHSLDRITDVQQQDEVRSWNEVAERVHVLKTARLPLRDQWLVEELILDGRQPARDLKFYAFYGEILFVQEIERLPTFRRQFWSPDGQRIETGKVNELDKAYGITKEQIVLAQRVSLEIPAPFMRIDMLRAGKRDLVLGEFTPWPGQFEEFNQATDRLMGEAWVRAERRLLDDAFSGKRFNAFDAAVGAP